MRSRIQSLLLLCFSAQLLDGLPLIYVLFPDNLFYPFFLRMVLKLSMTGHTPIALSVVLNTFLLGVL